MKIVWIIDNKFRELYGLYDLKKSLSKKDIKVYFFYIPLWKTAIDLINPNIVVVPNLYKSSCEPIVNYAGKKNIDIFMHSSEGMYYTDITQKEKYPEHVIKKVKKFLVWSKLDSNYLIKKGLKKRVVESGSLKFDKKNYLFKRRSNNHIKIIGIPTHLRMITGSGISKSNIPRWLKKNILDQNYERLGYFKFEYEYIELITKIIDKLNKKFNIVFKVSPFEDPKIYKDTFPDQEIFPGEDARHFLRNVDVVLNVYSSISVDAIKHNVPVISLNKFVNWDKAVLKTKKVGPNATMGAVRIGIEPRNINEVVSLLKKDKKYLLRLCKKKDLFKKADALAGTYDTLGIMTNLFVNYKKNIKEKPFNYLYYLKYFLVEIKQILFGRIRPANFKRWRLSDQKLLYKFRISK